MGPTVYILGALTTFLCARLLLRAARNSKTPLLLWSGLCFAGLTVSNVLRFVDLVLIGPETELFALRLITAIVSLSLLLYGLIWDSR